MSRRIRLTLEYDGTDFAGWQLQPGQRTVQGVVEAAAGKLLSLDDRVMVQASGRTDSGVHALAQVVAVDDPRAMPLEAWDEGLHRFLPSDVAVVGATLAEADFDPRRNATGKRYVYRIWNGPSRRPLRRRSSWWLPRPLEVPAMQAAAPLLLGHHDFSSFRAARCNAKSSHRTLTRLEVEGESGCEVRITAEGDGFLRHMVRIIVGTLVEVGELRRAPESVGAVLEARDRRSAGRTAASEGLTLEEVYYD